MHMPRHLIASALVAAAALTACGGGTSTTTADSDTASGSASSVTSTPSDPLESAAAAETFPVTIEHMFGETVVPEPPERVVTLGFNGQDFTLALGVVPVGIREYLAYDYESRPWAQDLLPEESIPTVGGEEIDIEGVAALDPDVIVAIYSFIDEDLYALLSDIAPTVAQPGEYEVGGTPWQEQLRMTGRALGREDRAGATVEEVEALFAEAREAHPEFEGRTVAVAFWFEGEFFILEPQDLRARFFQDLGFAMPETTGAISAEQLSLLDQDVLVVVGARPADLADNEVFKNLDVVQQGRTVHLGQFSDDFGGALGFGSPLSLPYALEVAVPRLADATDDDPSTIPAVFP